MGQIFIERLTDRHVREPFLCRREPEIETFFRERVDGEERNGGCRCYVLLHEDRGDEPIGFYTLSASILRLSELSQSEKVNLPYPTVPTLLLGRMGVDDRYQGRGYGTTLLLHAFCTAFETLELIGHVGVLVDAKNDALVTYYKKHGFELVKGHRLFISVDRMEAVCTREGLDLEIPRNRLKRQDQFEASG